MSSSTETDRKCGKFNENVVTGPFKFCYPCNMLLAAKKTRKCDKCNTEIIPKYRLCYTCKGKSYARKYDKLAEVMSL